MSDWLGLGELSDNGVELVKLIYPDVIQPSMRKIGQALETIFDLPNLFLMPLQGASERAKLRFSKRMEEYKKQLEKYNEDDIVSVPVELAVPLIEGLITISNEQVAEYYKNLLLNASLSYKTGLVHPNLIHCLRSIGPEEVKIIEYYRKNNEAIIIAIFNKGQNDEIADLRRRFIPPNEEIKLSNYENHDFYYNNLVQLGIMELFAVNGDKAKELQKLSIVNKVIKELEEEDYKFLQLGSMKLTILGERLIECVSAE